MTARVRWIPLLALLVCIQVLISESTTAAEPVLLRYKFQPQQVARYSVQMRDDYLVQVGNAQERPYTSQSSIKSYRVLSVDEQGNAQLELTLLEQVRVETFQNGETLKFDSTMPDQEVPELLLPMKAMVGQPHLRLTVSPTGKVSNVTPLGGAKTGDGGNEAAMDVLVRLPEEPVEVGSRWTEDYAVPVSVPPALKKNVNMQRQFELKSVENNIATIEYKTKCLTPLTVPEEEVQLLLRTPTVTIQLDLTQGLIVSRTLSLDNLVAGLEKGTATVTVKQNHVEKLLPVRQASIPAGN